MSNEAKQFLASMDRVVRRMANTTSQVPEESSERIRGSIHWARTLQLQAEAGHKGVYATYPVERTYATAENAVVWHTLEALSKSAHFASRVFNANTELGADVASAAGRSSRWLRHPLLTELVVPRPSQRDVCKVKRGRRSRDYAPALAAWDLHQALSGRLDKTRLADVASQTAILNLDMAALFEVSVFFALVDSLERAGFDFGAPRIHFGSPAMRGSRGSQSVVVNFQPNLMKASASVYGRTLANHGIGSSALIPDVALVMESPHSSWLLVEIKGGPKRRHADNLRRATFDLLAYNTYFADCSIERHYLGVGWGQGTSPNWQERFALCSPEFLDTAVAGWLEAASMPSATAEEIS